MKIPRPRFARRNQGSSGRVEHDDRGNAVWVRTRVTDTPDLDVNSTLALVDDDVASGDGNARRGSAPPKVAAAKTKPAKHRR